MGEFNQRLLTASIVLPTVFILIRIKLGAALICHFLCALAYHEISDLICNVLKTNNSTADNHYIDNMKSTLATKAVIHVYFLIVHLSNTENSLIYGYYVSIIFFCLIRIYNYVSSSAFIDTQQEGTDLVQYLDRRFLNLTFLQLCADIFCFSAFIFPMGFVLNFYLYQNGAGFTFLWLMATFQADNGALFFGKTFGFHKFVPKVSPNKTWEGVSGAIFLSVISCFILSLFRSSGLYFIPDIPTQHYLIISVLISIASVFGDFVQSFFKRASGQKDSGNFFPGHGGVLDRLDSLNFSAPAIYLYVVMYLREYLVPLE